MKDKRVLVVSSELTPYLPENEMSKLAFQAAKNIHSKGGQTRIFIPRYGLINERRHQLHEVIRLSGMNLVINDMDMPLIIKVASIPRERMQVYFIDNDEYFKRKATFTDEDNNLFEDNDERTIFFAKGVIETVKKLNWSPDIIHIHGWMSSLLPVYIREHYKDEPLFAESKIVTSIYGETSFEGELNKELTNKIAFDTIDKEKLSLLTQPSYNNLIKIAIKNSDAIIKASENIDTEIDDYLKSLKKPTLNFISEEEMGEAYTSFYEKII